MRDESAASTANGVDHTDGRVRNSRREKHEGLATPARQSSDCQPLPFVRKTLIPEVKANYVQRQNRQIETLSAA